MDIEIQERLEFVDKRAQDVTAGLERLPVQIDILWQRLADLERLLSNDVLDVVEVRWATLGNFR